MSKKQRIKSKGITIDGSDSHDLDDAFWLEEEGDTTILHVSITDVSEAIAIDSPLDIKAQQKCFTRYLKALNRPMLPHRYSEGSLSLLENKERLTVTFSIPIDEEGNTKTPQFQKTYLQNKAQLSYKLAEEIMLSPEHELHTVLNKAHHLAQRLFKKRKQDGAITLYNLRQGFATSEDGFIKIMTTDESYNSHIVIQEFMILVNQVVARFFAENDIPGLYRNHTSKAVAPERDTLLKDIAHLTNIGDNERLRTLANKFTLIFNKATYAPVIEGHYALNLPAYMHITSPIRRYADLVNMRQLSAFLANEEYPYSNEQLSQIGTHINTVMLAYQNEKSHFFKGKMHKRNVNILNNRQDFSALEGNDLYLLVKTAIYEDRLPENLLTTLVNYLGNEKIDLRLLFLILFKATDSEHWHTLKIKILALLSQRLHDATSLLSIATNKLNWQQIRYDKRTLSNPPPHLFTTIARVTIKDEEFVSDSQAKQIIKNKKTSEQLANFDLLCKILKIDNNFSNTISVHLAENNQHTTPNTAPLTNYVGKLLELCNKKGWETVQYEYEKQGYSHQPLFSVYAKIVINGETYCSEKIQGGNKKSIKQLASASLMDKISCLPDSATEKAAANFVGLLNNLLQQQNTPPPTYHFHQDDGPFKCICTISPTQTRAAKETAAYGKSKKIAKNLAAEKMWNLL